ncbi:MAG: hypothetical protein ACM3QZ_14930 [Solirubrobacterales bacterium]
MERHDRWGLATQQKLREINVHDDFELDDIEEEENITVYDVDNVLGFTTDIMKVGFPFLFLIGMFISMIYMFGMVL